MGGQSACQLLSVLEAKFSLFAESSSFGSDRKYNSLGTCTIRLDWLRKPQKMVFSSRPTDANLPFSSFRVIDFAFHFISNLSTEAEVIATLLCYFVFYFQRQVPSEMMDVQQQRCSRVVEACLGILCSMISHAHTLSAAATDDAGSFPVLTFDKSIHSQAVQNVVASSLFAPTAFCSRCCRQLLWNLCFCTK